MNEVFIQRRLLTKWKDDLRDTYVYITKPAVGDDGLYVSLVKFSNIKKYDAKIRGADEFNAIECAIAYANGVSKNSEDPEFYSPEGESLFAVDSPSG